MDKILAFKGSVWANAVMKTLQNAEHLWLADEREGSFAVDMKSEKCNHGTYRTVLRERHSRYDRQTLLVTCDMWQWLLLPASRSVLRFRLGWRKRCSMAKHLSTNGWSATSQIAAKRMDLSNIEEHSCASCNKSSESKSNLSSAAFWVNIDDRCRHRFCDKCYQKEFSIKRQVGVEGISNL